jgi:ABC-type hemin transport system substrate-binding protein
VPCPSLIGSLLYASANTRPNITMAVSHLSRCMASHAQSHWEHGKRVLFYLKGTAVSCLVYGRGVSSAGLKG